MMNIYGFVSGILFAVVAIHMAKNGLELAMVAMAVFSAFCFFAGYKGLGFFDPKDDAQ